MTEPEQDHHDGPLEDLEEATEKVYVNMRRDILGRTGYQGVLVMVIVTMVMIPIGLSFRGGALLTTLSLAALVVLSMSRSHVSRKLALVSYVVMAVLVTVGFIVTVTGQPVDEPSAWLPATFTLCYTLVIALCFPVILREAFSHKRVTLNTVAASLAAYLLIGLIFAGLYRFVNLVAFPMFSQPNTNGFTSEYFSYVTLSTVGYGDYTAANDAGRTLAMLEALLGQAFLVTIVALVVSNLGRAHVKLRGEAASDGPDSTSD